LDAVINTCEAIFSFIICLILGVLCVVFFAFAYALTYYRRDGEKYRLHMLLALDRTGNASIEGSDREYISSMLGRRYMERKRYAFWRLVIDAAWIVIYGERNHCVNTYERYKE
jgi:hypothetical protein